MYVTLVQVRVLPASRAAFIDACRLNHEASIQEPGNRRFDILQDTRAPDCFVLYEAYDSAENAAQHKTTAHYQRWRDQVAPMMAEPRQGIAYHGLFPTT